MKAKDLRAIILTTALMASASCSLLRAQDIASIAKSDPLIITGALGSQNTFYQSSGSLLGSQWNSSLYANLNFNIYGMSMPFSFYYTNDNAAYSLPRISFNISPTYKGWTLHLGQRSMPFSSYVFSMPFNGVGIEYSMRNERSFRFGAFYGTLKKAVNVNSDDFTTSTPQYRRTGWGLKLGYGSSRNYLDLYLFRAKDHLSSIDECWYDQVYAQENIAVGARGRFSLGRHLSLTTNFATSLFSTDIRTRTLESDMADKYSYIFDVRYSSLFRWAGDVGLNFNLGRFSTSVSYRLVQPDYTSLGISYVSNNFQSLSANIGTSFKKLNLSASFSGQEDNISGEQLYTTRGFVYSGSANWTANSHLYINASYNGYLQRQYDGTAHVNDSTRVNRVMNSWSLSPSYNFQSVNLTHTISVSANYSQNKDLNPYSTGESDVNTLALGCNYSCTVTPIATNFSLSASHQQSEGYNTQYRTQIYSFNTSRSFLESKALNLSATVSLTNNQILDQTSNMSLGGALSASYTLLKVHSFSLSTSYNRYASQNFQTTEPRLENYTFNSSLNYNYTFSVFHLKRRAEKGAKRQWTSDWSRSHRTVR